MVKGAGVVTPTRPSDASDRFLRRAVICVADEGLRAQLAHALERAGFVTVALLDRGIETLPAVADAAPDLVLVDVSLVGTVGLRLLGMIKELAPHATILALSPFATIDVAVLEAGADAVVPVDDLRALHEVLVTSSRNPEATGPGQKTP